MTNLVKGGRTPARVAQTATKKVDLGSGSDTLIGVFGPEQAMKALVRDSNGRIRKVKRGSRISAGLVVAIDAKGLMVQRSGKVHRMEIPAG